jgi:hypothetical protein
MINGLYDIFLEWQKKDTIMVVVDRFSKLAKFGPTKITTTMTKTTKLFDMWVKHNSMLEVIMSDHDEKFTLEFEILLLKKVGTKLKFNIEIHPHVMLICMASYMTAGYGHANHAF